MQLTHQRSHRCRHISNISPSVHQGSTSAATPELSPLVSSLLSPLWRDEAGARLLIAAVEDSVTTGVESTGRAEETGSAEGGEDVERVGWGGWEGEMG